MALRWTRGDELLNKDTGSHSLIIAYVFRIYTHIWTSHANFPPNSQHVRTHMNLFLPRSYVREFERHVHEVSHLHRTRPHYLHIRAFRIYSEQTRSGQIFEQPSVPFSPVQTHKILSYRPRLQTSREPALHTAYSEKPRSWTKRNFSYTFTIWWNVWWQD